MKKYTVWVSNADAIAEICEIDHDLLRYENLAWDDAVRLIRQSIDQGFLVIMAAEV